MPRIIIFILLSLSVTLFSCDKKHEEQFFNEKDYQINPTPDPCEPNNIYIPKNLEEAHQELKKMLPEELVIKIKDGKEEDMAWHHMGLGLWMRNNWGLWAKSRLCEYFISIGIGHPDDMSSIILESFRYYLRDETYPLKERISEYQEYWEAMMTPEEGSPIDGGKIVWLITQSPKDRSSPIGTVHLGLSITDKTGWRYEYGSERGIQPTFSSEDIQLDWYRTKDLNDFMR
jgi:hypothetical protein